VSLSLSLSLSLSFSDPDFRDALRKWTPRRRGRSKPRDQVAERTLLRDELELDSVVNKKGWRANVQKERERERERKRERERLLVVMGRQSRPI